MKGALLGVVEYDNEEDGFSKNDIEYTHFCYFRENSSYDSFPDLIVNLDEDADYKIEKMLSNEDLGVEKDSDDWHGRVSIVSSTFLDPDDGAFFPEIDN